MKMLLAGLSIAAFVAVPAFAQSYDPSIGSGNLTPPGATSRGIGPARPDRGYAWRGGAYDAYAWSPGFAANAWSPGYGAWHYGAWHYGAWHYGSWNHRRLFYRDRGFVR